MNTDMNIADQNTERLIQAAYGVDPVSPAFAASLQAKLEAAAQTQPQSMPMPSKRWRRAALIVGGLAACVLIGIALKPVVQQVTEKSHQVKKPIEVASTPQAPPVRQAKWTDDARDGMMPRQRPDAPALAVLKDGETLTTKAGQRRLVQLGDGTRLYVNEKTEVEATAARQLTVHKGQIYLEVAPLDGSPRFVVMVGDREITATGTHFAVDADTGVTVTQGKVAVKGVEIAAGQQFAPKASAVTAAPRVSHTLAWTRELMAAAETPMVPNCQHAGGALLALDPQGQEIKLSLRKYHIDVHIEDGFARTTIDQTYFNTTWDRLEGTFYFPLPADASLSRLAMYVADGNNQCKLMEGGMAERKHAADVYETIRYQRRDPALLEWLDGSTFKMRVFPLEAKQEKRIVLSYTQKLASLYGNTRYRFAGGHDMPIVREWSFNARIKSGAGMTIWSPSHADMLAIPQGGDTLLRHFANDVKPADDVVLEMQDRNAHVDQDEPRFTSFLHENQQYLMLRYRPTLPNLPARQRRDWIVLFEASAGRDPLLAGTQVDVFRQILKNAEYDDTFTLITANSRTQTFNPGEPSPVRGRVTNSARNLNDAIKFLQATHLVGALDLEQGLQVALNLAKDAKNPHLLHIGDGIPAMGERDAGKLAKMLPEHVRYVGVGVGKRWNRAFMKAAAERTGGLFTQINPDEGITWRAFELMATLNTPRLLDVHVLDANGKASFLMETTMIAQGEELCAITRVDFSKSAMPGKVIVKGTLDGRAFVKEIPVVNVLADAGYLPRTWAKQEIDRLLAANAAQHKDEIIALSKAMYVMSPFTSLLVLETDADYEKYKVDKGRKDHWAMYACPPKIPLVYEPDGKPPVKIEAKKGAKPTCEEVMGTIVGHSYYEGRFKDILVKVNETRTGSLMLGSGSPTFRVVDLDPSMSEFDTDIQYMAERIAEVSVRGKINADEAVGIRDGERFGTRINLPAPFGFITKGQGGGLEVGGYGPKGLSLQGAFFGRSGATREYALRLGGGTQEQMSNITRLMKQNRLQEAEHHARRLRELNPDNLAAAAALNIIQVRREQAAVDKEINSKDHFFLESLKADFGDALDMDNPVSFGRFGSGKRGSLQIEENPLARVGEVIIVGNTVSQDRVIRRMVKGIQPGLILRYPELGNGGVSTSIPFMSVYGDPLSMGLPSGGDGLPSLFANSPGRLVTFGRGIYPTTSNPETAGPNGATFLYQRPPFDYNRHTFTDLVQYAPGLHNTHADIMATLEAEADVEAPKLGTIDADARRLIERGRSADWLTLTVAAEGPLPGYKIHYNGIGQFAYTRILVSGLREQVVCDGKTLWHLYPEIGLAAKRPFSRWQQNLAASFNPAFLPSAEELARGYDVKAIDASTVALIPLTPSPSPPVGRGEKFRTHLVFAKDGRLSERRIVEMPSAKTVLRQIFQADGAIEWQDVAGKSLAKQTRTIEPAKTPDLVPKTETLLVIAFPIRTREHITAQAGKRGADWLNSHEAAVELFIADMTGPMIRQAAVHLGKLLHNESERRLGFYVLLNASGTGLATQHLNSPGEKAYAFDIEKDHPNNPLAMFLAQGQREIAGNDQTLIKNLPGPKDGFLQRMTRFRNLWLTWQNARPMQSGADMPLEMAKVIEFLQETPSPTFAYAVLDTMQRRSNKPPTDHMLDIAVKRFGPISDPLGLGYVFRYEHARSLSQAGKVAESVKAFTSLHADTLKLGIVPPIDAAFRDVLQMPIGDGPKFIGFTRKTLDELLGKKRFGSAFQLAVQMHQLGDEALGDEILGAILARASAEERNGLTLVCVRLLAERKNFVQADRLLVKVLEDKKLSQYAELWRWRAELTKGYGQTATAIQCLEKALDLEYAELPELVNLESIRSDYRTLLNHYQKIAEASASLEKDALTPHPSPKGRGENGSPNPSPKGRGEKMVAFLAKVIRTADRWRLIDADASEPSQLAGKILHTLGERELAWDYWTTPIDLHPAESKPWLDLAETMKSEGDLERADRAFGLAFEAETSNPEILWKRAQNQVRLGAPDRARQFYRQIADGNWQERFNATVEQARGLAER